MTVGKSADCFGHPRGLLYLCLAEGGERFSFFGMQSLLVLYLTHQLLRPGHVEQVVGFGVVRTAIEAVTGPLSEAALASQLFGIYAGFVYLTPLLGGFLADRWLGQTFTVTAGALLMAAGHFLMAFEWSFLLAVLLLLTGVGAFKGNITSQVGALYPAGDPRRTAAYQVFQFSISTAVIASGLVCGTLGEKAGWHYGFGAAGVGMLLALAAYLRGRRWLPAQGVRAVGPSDSGQKLSSREKKTVLLLTALVPLIAGAQLANQQMFNAFLVWGERNFDLRWAGFVMPVTWLLSADSALSSALLAAMIAFWAWCRRRGCEPAEITKIALGAAFMTLAALLLAAASLPLAVPGVKISIGWGIAFEFINEIGFVMMIPANLALFSGAAPKRVQGVMIGVYFLAFLLANLAVGWLGGRLDRMSSFSFWLLHAGIVAGSTVLLALVALRGRRLLAPEI